MRDVSSEKNTPRAISRDVERIELEIQFRT